MRHWSLVGGVVLPLLPVAVYNYIAVAGLEEPNRLSVSPWYPVMMLLGMGLPPLLVVGNILAFALPRPSSSPARFGLGLAVGAGLIAVAAIFAPRF